MKALEKDRNRRYETASGLAADVQRYLHDEPVQACPPSAWYRFRKFVRRNKTALAVAALVLADVVLGAGGMAKAQYERSARRTPYCRLGSSVPFLVVGLPFATRSCRRPGRLWHGPASLPTWQTRI
jgi:hypothetical protein